VWDKRAPGASDFLIVYQNRRGHVEPVKLEKSLAAQETLVHLDPPAVGPVLFVDPPEVLRIQALVRVGNHPRSVQIDVNLTRHVRLYLDAVGTRKAPGAV